MSAAHRSTNATGAGVDQDLLSFLQVRRLDQHLPGSETHQRDGSHVLHTEVLRLQHHVGFVDQFRERPHPAIAGSGIDLVPQLEAPDIRSDAHDRSGHFVTEDERWRGFTPVAWIWTKTSSSRITGSGISPARMRSLLP